MNGIITSTLGPNAEDSLTELKHNAQSNSHCVQTNQLCMYVEMKTYGLRTHNLSQKT